MTTIAERVARAICLGLGLDPDADWRERDGLILAVDLPQEERPTWTRYHKAALAALTDIQRTHAIVPREPSDAMLDAAVEKVIGPAHVDQEIAAPEAVWSAMIEAAPAIREGKGE